MKYGMVELMFPAVVKPQTDKTAATLSQTTFGELRQTPDSIPGYFRMPQRTSQPGSSQIRLASEKPQ